MDSSGDLKARFLQILHRHHGARNAIQVRELAAKLGVGETRNGERIVRVIKREVADSGVLIGSSCGRQSGYFIPETQEEIRATLGNYEARLKSLAALIRKTKGAAGFKEYLGRLAMEFEEEGAEA